MDWSKIVAFGVKWGPAFIQFIQSEADDVTHFVADFEAAQKTQNFIPLLVKWGPTWAKVVQTNAPNFKALVADVESLFATTSSSGGSPFPGLPNFPPIFGSPQAPANPAPGGFSPPPGGFRS